VIRIIGRTRLQQYGKSRLRRRMTGSRLSPAIPVQRRTGRGVGVGYQVGIEFHPGFNPSKVDDVAGTHPALAGYAHPIQKCAVGRAVFPDDYRRAVNVNLAMVGRNRTVANDDRVLRAATNARAPFRQFAGLVGKIGTDDDQARHDDKAAESGRAELGRRAGYSACPTSCDCRVGPNPTLLAASCTTSFPANFNVTVIAYGVS